MDKIRIGIAGAAGYTAGELLRLLLHHPGAQVVFAYSKSNAGNPVHKVHADLLGETDLRFSDQLSNDIDVLFFCMGHGETRKFLELNPLPPAVSIIDLSNDFRLQHQSVFEGRQFTYGLPELNYEKLKGASNIANPGCFATAIQLGLLPLAQEGLLLDDDVYTTAITGSTGAGQSLSATSHFSWRANNIQAYKTLTHQHLGEIYQSLHQLQPGFAAGPADEGNHLHLVPWRGDFTRGIFASSTIQCDAPITELYQLYDAFYAAHPFTFTSQEPIYLKQVVNTNKCVVQLERVGTKLVVHTAIDNLLKGASGQAVQNMNLMFGLSETAGLQLKAAAF